MKTPEELRAEILELTSQYTASVHGALAPDAVRTFRPGVDTVPYGGRVFDDAEVRAAVSSALQFWLTLGAEGEGFEKELATFLGVRSSIVVNSGSSANLLAFSALTSHKLGDRRIRPGDEVITVAAGFPTTVAPILQAGAVPVFIDSDPLTLNARSDQLAAAYSPGKTKAVMMAHTLGNPFDLQAVTAFCRTHGLWLIEDNCDALGATYTMPGQAARVTGSFGDLSTQSFYPPHHLTMGEGGAVNIVSESRLKMLVESFRDWGRDCWCPSGKDNTCKKRYGWQLGDLPEGYDHKYIYTHLGYNLKPLDLQAAIGREQLRKLPLFGERRRSNWSRLRARLADLEEFFDFHLPTHATQWRDGAFTFPGGGPECAPSWFGFMLLRKATAPFTRPEMARFLEERKIGNRPLFGGNLVRQPVFTQMRADASAGNTAMPFRVVGELPGADRIMNDALFVGVYPGLSTDMLDYVAQSIRAFVRRH